MLSPKYYYSIFTRMYNNQDSFVNCGVLYFIKDYFIRNNFREIIESDPPTHFNCDIQVFFFFFL